MTQNCEPPPPPDQFLKLGYSATSTIFPKPNAIFFRLFLLQFCRSKLVRDGKGAVASGRCAYFFSHLDALAESNS